MNKHLISIVAVAAVTSLGTTSIPASAETLDDVKAAITNSINGLKVIGLYTSSDDIKELYADTMQNTDMDTEVSIFENTPGKATVNVKINDVTTPSAVTLLDTLTFEGIPFMQTANDLEYVIKKDFDKQYSNTILTADKTLSRMEEHIENKNLSIKIDSFNITEATSSSEGKIEVSAIIMDAGNNNVETKFDFTMLTQRKNTIEEDEIISKITNIIEAMDKSGEFTGTTVKDAVADGLKDYNGLNIDVYADAHCENNSALGSYMVSGYIYNDDRTIDSTIDLNGYFYKKIDPNKSIDDIGDCISISLSYLYENDRDLETIQNTINKLLEGTSVKGVVSDYVEIPKTDTTFGELAYKVKLTDTRNGLTNIIYSQQSTNEPRSINSNQTFEEYKDAVAKSLNSLLVSNSTTISDIERAIAGKIQKWGIGGCIKDYSLTPATTSKAGSVVVTVWVSEDSYNENGKNVKEDEIKTTLIIPKLSSNSSGSGSSGHSSGGSSSSSTTNSTSTTTNSANTSAAGTATNTATEITKPVSLANMSKEAVKAVEAKVVSKISTIIGEGVSVGQTKEISAPDGNKLSVTPIAKEGKSTGAVITAQAASTQAIIPIDKNSEQVTAVYKYVPLLEKYIQVQDAVITADAITLHVQANATYVASPVALSTTETIKQGWVQSGDNWYMVNAKGDPLTGWQKDSAGWTYMSQTTGAMQTGWAKDGNSWYYLKNNGYMATGWIKDGATWYYCNADGSMAANTIINGYKVGPNGAWIS